MPLPDRVVTIGFKPNMLICSGLVVSREVYLIMLTACAHTHRNTISGDKHL